VYELEQPRGSENAVSRIVLTHLAGRWSPAILQQLQMGERRYSQLRWAIDGVSEKMLAQTLRELERDGLVLRTSYPVLPPHVVYKLSPLGDACARHVWTLVDWLDENASAIERAQSVYTHRRSQCR
jgi:DNA-binding HxlR family transcriptional regulator